VIETKLVREVGGFRRGFEGAQDWDLFLRVTERLNHGEIKHLPFILYHWRAMSGSTAAGTLHKPYVLEAQKKAVSEHLTRRGISADVSILHDISQLRVSFNLPSNPPLVSIIIPTRDQVDFLGRCVDSILKKTIYPNYEIIIVDNNSEQQDTFTYFASVVRNQKVKVVRDERPFNFSALNNRAVDYCNGSVFAFVNNDIEVITPEWLGELVSYALRPEVGAVGARLLYPNGILQHGGVILGIGGIAGHNHKGRPRHDVGYFNRAILPQNLSAVTAACLVMRKEVFDEVGGFDEEHLAVAFNDVDLCLRIREHGYLNVYNPYAECYHHESVSRGYETTREKFNRFEGEIATMKKRWGTQLAADPYYNPNLTLLAEDFGFAYPPRVTKPWLN
jgi:GT2 family glycosyltransferase